MKTWLFALGAVLAAVSVASTTGEHKGIGQRCDVRTYLAHDVPGSRCNYWDEVMVGIKSVDPLTIRCARLEVTCPDRIDDGQKRDPEEGK